MVEHNPSQPAWSCVGCGQVWPCPERRRSYRQEFTGEPVALALLMASWLAVACRDLVDGDEELYCRFLGWIKEA